MRENPHWLRVAQAVWTSIKERHDRYSHVVTKHEQVQKRYADALAGIEKLREEKCAVEREESKALVASRTPAAWRTHFPGETPPADNQKDLSAWGKKRLREIGALINAANAKVHDAEHIIEHGPDLIEEARIERSHFEDHDLGQAWQHIFREALPPRPCVIDEWSDGKQTYVLYAGGRIATTGEYEGILTTEGGFTMYDELLDSITAAQSRLGELQKTLASVSDELVALVRDLSAKKAQADANAQKAKDEQAAASS
ncbi:MAG TPA: hypothetical protein VGY48_16045 [Vicinamibacterales bacterium]|jgi:hypothetical protein|nr:hypothetical protein [Vicinamibacterales bacterium]